MGEQRIANAVASNLQNVQKDFSVPAQTTDSVNEGGGETRWENEKWEQYFGYYKAIPELRAVIDAKATWTVGKGFKADEITTMILDTIKGWGKDTFNTILENLIRTMHIGGDAFAEIIRDEEENLINLKPLDPSVVVIVTNNKGVIIRYEMNAKSEQPNKKINPEKMFHLARNRVADEIHGVSLIESLEDVILAKNEAMSDMKVLMHRYVKPQRIFNLATDDVSEIAAFKLKADKATADVENLYLPKDTVEHEIVAVAANSTLNPLPWIESLNNQFYQTSGVPQIILGGSNEFTEATAKIAYLAFQQTIEEDQLYIEEQTLHQLNLVIELEFPASLENELLSDKGKDVETGAAQPNETTAGVGQ